MGEKKGSAGSLARGAGGCRGRDWADAMWYILGEGALLERGHKIRGVKALCKIFTVWSGSAEAAQWDRPWPFECYLMDTAALYVVAERGRRVELREAWE